MDKWHGVIGFIEQNEIDTDVWEEVVTEKERNGEVIRRTHKMSGAQEVNSNFTVNNEISVLADDYLLDHSAWIRYIEYLGAFWTVTSITPNYPRLLLTLGEVYNGKRPKEETESASSSDNGD